jgi:molybdenum cofactor cytidylyltransferase
VTVAAVILAAGASTRMGRPKALIEWQGRPFFMHCVDRAHRAGCTPTVVVWGAAALPGAWGASLVENSRWSDGPLSSLQVGLRAVLADDTTGVLVMTVDRPHVQQDTVNALVSAHRRNPDVVIQPKLNDESGHPILHPRSVVDAVRRLSPTDTIRTVLNEPEVRGSRLRIAVQDPAVLENLDTPEALRRLPTA